MSEPGLRVALDVSAIPTRPAGAGRYVVELARALAQRDDVDLVVASRRGDEARWRGHGSEVLGLAPRSVAGRMLYGELALGRALERRAHPDVLHGPHYTLPIGGRRAVVTIHDLTFLDHPEWHERSKVHVFGRALRHATSRADVIVVPSEQVRLGFIERFGDDRPVLVAHHGVDHDRFFLHQSDGDADAGVLTRLGVVWPYVVVVGTLEPRKNLVRLVRAFADVGARHPDLRLVLAGGLGWGMEGLQAAIGASPVAERIVRLGYVADDDVAPLLRRSAAAAYPALVEGFGLPALEALACGASLVTSKNSAMSEVTGDAALLVDPTDEEELAGALDAALVRGPEFEQRQAEGLRRAASFTWQGSAAIHLRAYDLAAQSPRRRHSQA